MLKNRVCIVTGGGGGIGREHSLLLASLGAKVVVNDLGGATDGSGGDIAVAQSVVDEIIAAGGEAVASAASVSSYSGAREIVSTALDTFGDLHVVVNNAGILRDRMLVSMSEVDFDEVVAVHLKGTFNVTRHAADFWRMQSKAGDDADRSVINTTSAAGLHGNPGQGNYAAAKAGIAALTVVHALELKRYGVRANAIAPVARTRMTLDAPGMGEAMVADPVFDPGNTSPLVGCLAAESSSFTGQVFSVYGGAVGIYGGWSIAEEVTTKGRWTSAALAEAMTDLPRRVKVNHQMGALARSLAGES